MPMLIKLCMAVKSMAATEFLSSRLMVKVTLVMLGKPFSLPKHYNERK